MMHELLGLGVVEEAANRVVDNLFDRGVLGLMCVGLILLLIIAGLVIRYQNKQIEKLNNIAPTDRERVITALNSAAEAISRTEHILRELKEAVDRRGDVSEALSGQIDKVESNFQHALNNLATTVKSTLDWTERMFARSSGREDEYERRRSRRDGDDR